VHDFRKAREAIPVFFFLLAWGQNLYQIRLITLQTAPGAKPCAPADPWP
jgi:hypothetical protein